MLERLAPPISPKTLKGCENKMNRIAPKLNVTPAVKKEDVEAQIQEQVNVLYSQEASIFEKEVAALNYGHLYNVYNTLFHNEPKHITKQ